MTRRRFHGRPVIWLVFAVMVGVPSAQLTRLLRAQRAARVESVPQRVEPVAVAPRRAHVDSVAEAPLDSSADDPGAFRYEPVGASKAPIAAAAVSRSGRLVAVLDDSGEVRVWDVRARKRVATIASRQRRPIQFVPSRDLVVIDEVNVGVPGTSLVGVAGNDGRFRAWTVPGGRAVLAGPHSVKDARPATSRGSPLVDVAVSTEGGAVSVSSNGSLALWRGGQSEDSSLIWMTRSPGGNVHDADIGPDDRAVAVAADDGIYLLTPHARLWTMLDARSGERQAGNGRWGSPREVQFSPGGGVLAAAWSNAEMRVYSVATRERLLTMAFGREGLGPTRLAFSPDGQQLAATDGHRVIQVWPVRAFGAPVALTAPRGPVRSMWFTADAKQLVIAEAGDRYLRALPLPPAR